MKLSLVYHTEGSICYLPQDQVELSRVILDNILKTQFISKSSKIVEKSLQCRCSSQTKEIRLQETHVAQMDNLFFI